jgi:copper resistance protein C
MMRRIAPIALALCTCVALAHSYLTGSSPNAGQTVRVMPKTVTLEFSAPVEVGFSTFKVYALANSSNVDQAAADLSTKVLPLKDDAAARADAGLVTQVSPAAKLELKLKDKLEPGWYVVMWRVLSVDGHVTTSRFVFEYASR